MSWNTKITKLLGIDYPTFRAAWPTFLTVSSLLP